MQMMKFALLVLLSFSSLLHLVDSKFQQNELLRRSKKLIYDDAKQQFESTGASQDLSKYLFLKYHHIFHEPDDASPDSKLAGNHSESLMDNLYSLMEKRKLDEYASESLNLNAIDHNNCFRVINKVFCKSQLPQSFGSARQKLVVPASNVNCVPHIGCIEEIPVYPNLFKKYNITTRFAFYNGENSQAGHRLQFEPLMHYQLEPGRHNSSELESILKQELKQTQIQTKPKPYVRIRSHLQEAASSKSSSSWRATSKVLHRQEHPFDLSLIERSGFDPSLTTRIIIGGFFAKEDEPWIEDVVKQWMRLEPNSNVIKVSWQDANRGFYTTAAFNSRIVARHLTLLLHYLDQMYTIDLNKFHLVGHSLGAHIAGFVGADFDGKIARITGLDPAGPIFIDLNTSLRLDPSDAQFVDVVHTNCGSLSKGALGLSTPSGHVDYYCNGGSLQPGCNNPSVSKAIMDPVERVACNHRRSYRYFLEIIKLAIKGEEDAPVGVESSSVSSNATGNCIDEVECGAAAAESQGRSTTTRNQVPFPKSFLFEADLADLVRLGNPEPVMLDGSKSRLRQESALAPLERQIEFHLLQPEFPRDKRGMYLLRTRSTSPFFSTKQYALTLRSPVEASAGIGAINKRRITLYVKVDQVQVIETDLDQIPSTCTLVFESDALDIASANFGPHDIGATHNDTSTSTQSTQSHLSIMWRPRPTIFQSISPLQQSNELRLLSIELVPLDLSPSAGSDADQLPVLRYSNSNSSTTSNQQLVIPRNQWRKFDGKLVRNVIHISSK